MNNLINFTKKILGIQLLMESTKKMSVKELILLALGTTIPLALTLIGCCEAKGTSWVLVFSIASALIVIITASNIAKNYATHKTTIAKVAFNNSLCSFLATGIYSIALASSPLWVEFALVHLLITAGIILALVEYKRIPKIICILGSVLLTVEGVFMFLNALASYVAMPEWTQMVIPTIVYVNTLLLILLLTIIIWIATSTDCFWNKWTFRFFSIAFFLLASNAFSFQCCCVLNTTYPDSITLYLVLSALTSFVLCCLCGLIGIIRYW